MGCGLGLSEVLARPFPFWDNVLSSFFDEHTIMNLGAKIDKKNEQDRKSPETC
jgi:hypothetical protein